MVVLGAGQDDASVGLAADAEDALNKAHLGLDNDALVRQHLDHLPAEVRLHPDGLGLAADHDLPGDGGDRLDGARDLGVTRVLEEAEDPLGLRERL